MAYYERCLTLLRKGGLIVVDNTLWSGAVAGASKDDEDTPRSAPSTTRCTATRASPYRVLPIGDGVTLALGSSSRPSWWPSHLVGGRLAGHLLLGLAGGFLGLVDRLLDRGARRAFVLLCLRILPVAGVDEHLGLVLRAGSPSRGTSTRGSHSRPRCRPSRSTHLRPPWRARPSSPRSRFTFAIFISSGLLREAATPSCCSP